MKKDKGESLPDTIREEMCGKEDRTGGVDPGSPQIPQLLGKGKLKAAKIFVGKKNLTMGTFVANPKGKKYLAEMDVDQTSKVSDPTDARPGKKKKKMRKSRNKKTGGRR